MTAEHTPTPWHLIDNGSYFEVVVPWKDDGIGEVNQYCPTVCTVAHEGNDGIVGKPNAEFIVRAANSHQQLVDALRKIAEDAKAAQGGDAEEWAMELYDIECAARAALAATEGK